MDSIERNIGYYDNPRPEILELLGVNYQKSLDVGCGTGRFSLGLKKSQKVKAAHGVELFPAAILEAKKNLDQVFVLDLSKDTPSSEMRDYDLVLALDVLEHMMEPWTALKKIRDCMKKDASLVVSLPNVRNFRVVLPLLLKGDWKYEESGLLDSTHIRFFTKKTAIQLLEGAGFEIEKISTTGCRAYSKSWLLNLLTFGIFRPFLEFQYLIVAKKR